MIVSVQCKVCGKMFNLDIQLKDLDAYATGEKSVQEAFPYLKCEERELIASGICKECHDYVFSEFSI